MYFAPGAEIFVQTHGGIEILLATFRTDCASFIQVNKIWLEYRWTNQLASHK